MESNWRCIVPVCICGRKSGSPAIPVAFLVVPFGGPCSQNEKAYGRQGWSKIRPGHVESQNDLVNATCSFNSQ